MPTKKRPRGCPPGVARNPEGKNQYAEPSRTPMLGCRLSPAMQEKFLAKVQAIGLTKTEAMRLAIERWVESDDS